MRTCHRYLIVACLTVSPLVAHAADLERIERVVAKEPKYQGKPEYCLLVFGPEAKFRVWLVLDGTVLYVDRNGDGDLTRPTKRVGAIYNKDDFLVFRPGELSTLDGKTTYHLRLRKHGESWDMFIRLGKEGSALAGFDGPGPLRFAKRAADAPIVHILGPLTLQRFDPQPDSESAECKPGPFVPGQECKLGFSLGTPGLGAGTFAKLYFTGEGAASAEIRFPNGKKITASLPYDG